MNDKVKGIILKINDYKENDQMIFALCKDYGVLSLIGKSSRKISSKQHFYEGCYYEFMIDYKEGKTIFGIHGSKLIKAYYDLNNTALFSYKNIFLDLTYKAKDIIDNNCFENLLFMLEEINDGNKYLCGSLYLSYLLRIFGISPNVDECVMCGNKKVVAISSGQGGFLCIDHLKGERVLDVDTLRKFRLVAKANYTNFDDIKDKYSFEDFALLMDFFMHNSSINSKPYDFFKIIKG